MNIRLLSLIALLALSMLICGEKPMIGAEEEGGNNVKEYTVEELFAKKDALNGKTVKLKGKVVKFNAGIMKRNWIHLQDGSGKEGTNDITITTNQSAAVGSTVTVTGTVVTNKDFGFGYKYDVIIEDAVIW